MYTKQLPSMQSIRHAAELTRPFPARADEIIQQAKRAGLGRDVIDFLNQFHADDTFQSQSEFLTRCEELELLIREERNTPSESLRSPQD